MMDKQQAQQLITKYKKGLCNEDEIQLLHQWMDEQAIDEPDYTFTQDTQEDILKEEIRSNIKQKIFANKAKTNSPRLPFWLKIAAVLLLISSAGIWLWHSANNNRPEIYTTIYNPPGRLKTVVLPDGSKVFLNAASTISFSNRFGSETRKINLKGEAFFEVVHNAQSPFIVYTRNMRTQVLGTSFNVKAYDNEPDIKVAVVSGKVGVMAAQSSVMLTPNQTAYYNVKAGKLLKASIDDASSLKAWTTGQLVFKNQSVSDIAHILTRHYNTSIIIQNEHIASSVLNARFDKNESLENAISVLCTYVGASYKHSGNQYIIK